MHNQRTHHVLRSTFELLQELMRFALPHQAFTVKLLFMFADRCKYVNKCLNEICLSYNIKQLSLFRKFWLNHSIPIHLVLQSLYEDFEVSKW